LNIGENIGNSFDYAKKMFSDGGRIVILIILNLIPIVNWIVIGYSARVLRETPTSSVPPKLEKYGDLFVDGAKIFFASLIYMLIPAIVLGLGIGSFIASNVFQGQGFMPVFPGAVMFSGTGLLIILVAFVLAVVLLIVLGVGVAHMIKTGRFGKAFAFGEIFSIIRGMGWGRYLGWILLTVVIVLVVGGLSAIPFVGWIISIIISPVLSIFISRSLGLLYNEGAPPELRTQLAPVVVTGIVCSSCGATLQPYQKFCPACGAPAPAPPIQPPPTTTADTKFCISCGARIPSSAMFCGSCGAKQS
jgi:ribosomal protein L40E